MDKITVIIADNHVLIREGLSRLLEKTEDIECIGLAENGEEAIRLVCELHPDVAIVDVSMPKMNGVKVTSEIKRFSPTTAVIILSAYKYNSFVISCLEAGAVGYLLKKNLPYDGVANAIRMVFAGENVFDQEATRGILSSLTTGENKSIANQNRLGKRELEVLKLAVKGMSNKEIANKLGISNLTVGSHLNNIFKKLGIESRVEAVLYTLKEGIADIDELVDKSGD